MKLSNLNPCLHQRTLVLILCLLPFVYCAKTIIQDYPQNVSALIGSDILFKCSAIPDSNFDYTQIQWKDSSNYLLGTQNPNPLPGHEGRYSYIRSSKDELNLQIRKLSLSDDGTFECQLVRAGHHPQKASANVEVLVPPSDVFFVNYASGTTLDIREGTNLNITCASTGAKPKTDMRWYVNGQSFRNEEVQDWDINHINKTISTFSSIVWRPSREDNYKLITCEGKQIETGVSKRVNVTVNVLYPVEQPTIIFRSNSGDKNSVRSGDKISLLCIVKSGNPKPIVTWYSNNGKIDSEYEYNESSKETQSVYTFTAQAMDNEAVYECRASNGIGHEYSSQKIELAVMFKPQKVELLGKPAIKPGEVLPLQCISRKSNPPATISWQVNNRIVESDSLVSGDLMGNSQGTVSNISLSYKDAISNNGEVLVKCFAKNSMGTTEAHQLIRILSPPNRPEIFGVSDHHFYEGEYLNMTCEARGGNPLAVISWYRGVEKINATQNTISGDLSQSLLVLKLDRTMNKRPIRCEAENEALDSPLETHKSMKIVYSPKHVSIRVADSSRNYVRAGEASHLICTSRISNPAPHIIWEISERDKGQPVVKHGEYISRNESDFGDWNVENRLTFTPTEDMNGGIIQCIASHSTWREPVSSKFTLNVYYPPKMSYYQNKVSLSFKESEEFRENLTIFANPPVSSWLWKKGGVPFVNKVGSVYAHGASLGSQSLTKKDSGVYTLTASNVVGSANTSVILTVQYPAKITHISSPIYATNGDNVVFECEAEGEPRTDDMIKWYRDGKVVETAMREQRRAVLRLNASDTSDGKYTCAADNGIGAEHKQDAFLLVKKSPKIIRDYGSNKAAADIASDAKIVCKATAVPFAYFTWHIEGIRALNENSTKYSFYDFQVGYSTFQSILYISHVEEADYKRKIKCIVRNQMGEDIVDITLGPLTVPDMPQQITLLNATNDSLSVGWTPGFNGGSEQIFQVRYKNTLSTESFTLNTSDSFIVFDNLPPSQGYNFQIRAINRHDGVSDFSSTKLFHTLAADGAPKNVSSFSMSITAIPQEVILLIVFLVMVCLFINCILICRYKRNDAKKKIEEKTKIMRNLQSNDGGIGGGGIQKYGTMTPCTLRRPMLDTSNMNTDIMQDLASEDENSVRTMIEIPQNASNYIHVAQPNYGDEQVLIQYDADGAGYADIIRRTSPAILSHFPQQQHHQYESDFDASGRYPRGMTPSYTPIDVYGKYNKQPDSNMPSDSYRDLSSAFESPNHSMRAYQQQTTLPYDMNTYRSQGSSAVDEYQSYQYNGGTLNNNNSRRYITRSPQVLSTFTQPLTAVNSVMGANYSVSDGDLV
uniref:Nephrin n=1 Tax=Rhabditophanes sp. KR3021 TaxID=114890 RepID=A0AC35U7U6_9BILA